MAVHKARHTVELDFSGYNHSSEVLRTKVLKLGIICSYAHKHMSKMGNYSILIGEDLLNRRDSPILQSFTEHKTGYLWLQF